MMSILIYLEREVMIIFFSLIHDGKADLLEQFLYQMGFFGPFILIGLVIASLDVHKYHNYRKIVMIFILFQITIGAKIRCYESQINNLTNDQGREDIRNKLREEIKKANKRDEILSIEDREILKKFITKIQNELK